MGSTREPFDGSDGGDEGQKEHENACAETQHRPVSVQPASDFDATDDADGHER